MATDGPDPTPCDPEVFRDGVVVYTVSSISSNRMEGWVRKVRERSGQRVDWSYMGGCAVVRVIGDTGKVCAAISELVPELERLVAETAAAHSG